jgi:hypothetical protein
MFSRYKQIAGVSHAADLSEASSRVASGGSKAKAALLLCHCDHRTSDRRIMVFMDPNQKLSSLAMDILDHLRGHLLPQHRIEAETSLEKWTRAKTDKGRTTHLATSRSFNLAYWQGYRAAILNLQDALNNVKDAEHAMVIGNRSGHTPKAISMTGTNSGLRTR